MWKFISFSYNMLICIKPSEREVPLGEDLDPIPSSKTETYW